MRWDSSLISFLRSSFGFFSSSPFILALFSLVSLSFSLLSAFIFSISDEGWVARNVVWRQWGLERKNRRIITLAEGRTGSPERGKG